MHHALTDCGMDIYMFLEYLEQNASHAVKLLSGKLLETYSM
jgi:hypothetical protein